jgi:phosphoribosylglycinamide formyltransferase-1
MALRVAVFASGNGSNFQAIVDAVQAGKLDVSIELLVCDKPQAPVVARAERANIEAFIFKPKDYASREVYEQEILGMLQQKDIDLIVLAGYMRIITSALVGPYEGRMINIHPSLLPSFPGVNAIGQALEHGVKITGVTVHYVDGGLDSGPIIAQRSLDILPDDTEDSLAERIHHIEGELYPQVIGWIAAGKVSVEGRKVAVSLL